MIPMEPGEIGLPRNFEFCLDKMIIHSVVENEIDDRVNFIFPIKDSCVKLFLKTNPNILKSIFKAYIRNNDKIMSIIDNDRSNLSCALVLTYFDMDTCLEHGFETNLDVTIAFINKKHKNLGIVEGVHIFTIPTDIEFSYIYTVPMRQLVEKTLGLNIKGQNNACMTIDELQLFTYNFSTFFKGKVPKEIILEDIDWLKDLCKDIVDNNLVDKLQTRYGSTKAAEFAVDYMNNFKLKPQIIYNVDKG